MQSSIDLLIAYANKIALSLSIKEHAVNQRMIQQEGRTIYQLNTTASHLPFRRFSGPNGKNNSTEESSLCNNALEMVTVSKKLNDLFGQRTKLLIEDGLSRNLTAVKEESDGMEGIVHLPIESFKGLDIQLRWTKQKVRQFVLANYKNAPHEVKGLMKSLGLSYTTVRQWIHYDQKSEKIVKLREEVIKLALQQKVTYSDFKRLARRVYKTRMFRASDVWCMNYIRKYYLENIIDLQETQAYS